MQRAAASRRGGGRGGRQRGLRPWEQQTSCVTPASSSSGLRARRREPAEGGGSAAAAAAVAEALLLLLLQVEEVEEGAALLSSNRQAPSSSSSPPLALPSPLSGSRLPRRFPQPGLRGDRPRRRRRRERRRGRLCNCRVVERSGRRLSNWTNEKRKTLFLSLSLLSLLLPRTKSDTQLAFSCRRREVCSWQRHGEGAGKKGPGETQKRRARSNCVSRARR